MAASERGRVRRWIPALLLTEVRHGGQARGADRVGGSGPSRQKHAEPEAGGGPAGRGAPGRASQVPGYVSGTGAAAGLKRVFAAPACPSLESVSRSNSWEQLRGGLAGGGLLFTEFLLITEM